MSVTSALLAYHAAHNPYVHGHAAFSPETLALCNRAIAETIPHDRLATVLHGAVRDGMALAAFGRAAIDPVTSMLDAVFGQGGPTPQLGGILSQVLVTGGFIATAVATGVAGVMGSATGAVIGTLTGEGARRVADRLASAAAQGTFQAATVGATFLYVTVTQAAGVLTLVPKAIPTTACAVVGALVGAGRGTVEPVIPEVA
jgi:hypothetical protein